MNSVIPTIQSNANFHHLSGEDLFFRNDQRFQEYRKRWKEWPESFFVGEFPLFIDLEVTSLCNLQCPFCATTYRRHKIPQGFMDLSLAKRVIDEGAEKNLYGVKFNIRGEPLLHPQIVDFVRYAKEKGLVDVYFNTNALLLDERMAGNLIDAGLDRISISVEGHTKEVYEKFRVGSSFETIVKNIAGLRQRKERMGVTHPKVRVQTVLLPEVAASFSAYQAFWGSRADEVAYLDFKEMKEKKRGIPFPWACPQLWQRLGIQWNGTVLPCNHDDDAFLNLGNIHQSSITQCWHSKQLNGWRHLHQSGKAHLISACDGCYLRDSEIAKLQPPPRDE